MTKLSDIRADHDRDRGGSWFHWRGTIYLKVRRFGTRDYQRALRRAQLEHPAPGADATAEDKAQHEERLGAALIPAIAEHVLVDWWGMDAEEAPIEIAGATDTPVAVVDGVELRSLEFAGVIYRPEGSKWQQVEPYSVARATEILADPRCADLLDAVRSAAHILDVRRIREDVAAVGKLKSTSAGTSSSATEPKK
jgi:hypothetical protein